jgi:hypothetical protein
MSVLQALQAFGIFFSHLDGRPNQSDVANSSDLISTILGSYKLCDILVRLDRLETIDTTGQRFAAE